jgi:hypothetical protein
MLEDFKGFTFVIVSFPARDARTDSLTGQGAMDEYLFLCVRSNPPAIVAEVSYSQLHRFCRQWAPSVSPHY